MPDRLQTIVGHGGHCTSAAQAQQLPVARPVLADPPMAIPDQATADAGSSGAREPEAAAESVLEGAGTWLDIAHRLTQAPATDRIVAPHAGGVSDSGTHHGCMREHARAAADTTRIVVLI